MGSRRTSDIRETELDVQTIKIKNIYFENNIYIFATKFALLCATDNYIDSQSHNYS